MYVYIRAKIYLRGVRTLGAHHEAKEVQNHKVSCMGKQDWVGRGTLPQPRAIARRKP